MKLIFDIDPVPWQRPRAGKYGKTFFTHPKVRTFQTAIKQLAYNQYTEAPLEEALKVHVHCELVKPKTARRQYPSVKPDVDNLIKGVVDALNKVVWEDDCQIISLSGAKVYSKHGHGRITVIVTRAS